MDAFSFELFKRQDYSASLQISFLVRTLISEVVSPRDHPVYAKMTHMNPILLLLSVLVQKGINQRSEYPRQTSGLFLKI